MTRRRANAKRRRGARRRPPAHEWVGGRITEPTHLKGGRIPAATVEALFAASGALFALQPWTILDNPPIVRVDIPALGVEGACVVIIGAHDENRGILIFPSIDRFEEFHDAAETGDPEDSTIAVVADLLTLTFKSASDLPPSLRRETMEHRWRVKSPDAYPLLQSRDGEGLPRPLIKRDLEIAAACAESLCALLARHTAALSAAAFTPICESYFDDNDREARVTVPYDTFDYFHLGDPEEIVPDDDFEWSPEPGPFRPRAGRNEPCPCGSGRKYKKCHLAADEARHAESLRTTAAHRMDLELVDRLITFAERKLGQKWREATDDFADLCETPFLVRPWSVFSLKVDGRAAVDAYLQRRGRRCSPEERAWLQAQRAAWFSVWEVEAVDPGKTLTLYDLLSGERRTVRDTMASKSLAKRDAILGRVVDYDGMSLLAGVHSIPLPPYDAANVVDRARARLRRKRLVPAERLRDAAFGRGLVGYWEEAVEELRMQAALPPNLHNRDGDPLLLTLDRFEIAPGAAAEVEARIAELEGARNETDDDAPITYAILRLGDETLPAGENTVLGWLRLDADVLAIQTNSTARADDLRERIEAACGQRIKHDVREQTDPLAAEPRSETQQPELPPLSPEDEERAAEHKARHYAEWPDLPLPALSQKTPRECARTAGGRREVDLLLRQMENMEERAGGPAPFDFSILREELGIAPPN